MGYIDPLKIIHKYYKKDSFTYKLLLLHSSLVTKKAVEIAEKIKHMNPDISFIKEAAMLHDIGIFLTHEPSLGCFGKANYICHGFLGRELLEKEGLIKHALVCERHIGVGLSINDIKNQNLPLPHRDMLPISIEEKVICFADKFYSKKKDMASKEKTVEEIRAEISVFGRENIRRFDNLVALFK